MTGDNHITGWFRSSVYKVGLKRQLQSKAIRDLVPSYSPALPRECTLPPPSHPQGTKLLKSQRRVSLSSAISSARTFLLTFVYLASACSSLKKCYLLCEAVSITVFSVLHLRLHCLWFSVEHTLSSYISSCAQGPILLFRHPFSLSLFSTLSFLSDVNMSDLCHLKNKPQTVTESFHFSIPSPSPSWYYFSKEWCVPGASDFSHGTPSSTLALHSGSSKP